MFILKFVFAYAFGGLLFTLVIVTSSNTWWRSLRERPSSTASTWSLWQRLISVMILFQSWWTLYILFVPIRDGILNWPQLGTRRRHLPRQVICSRECEGFESGNISGRWTIVERLAHGHRNTWSGHCKNGDFISNTWTRHTQNQVPPTLTGCGGSHTKQTIRKTMNCSRNNSHWGDTHRLRQRILRPKWR